MTPTKIVEISFLRKIYMLLVCTIGVFPDPPPPSNLCGRHIWKPPYCLRNQGNYLFVAGKKEQRPRNLKSMWEWEWDGMNNECKVVRSILQSPATGIRAQSPYKKLQLQGRVNM